MKALIISADHFEDSELLYPRYRLQEEGMQEDVASIARGKIHGKHGYEVVVDKALRDVDPNQHDLLVLPGGKAPATIRKEPAAIAIAQAFMRSGKPVAAICHGPQILITAGVMHGRRATCYRSVARRPQRRAARGASAPGAGHDREPVLLQRPADHRHGRRPHPHGRGRRHDRRRHRVDDHHAADDGQQDRHEPGDLREGGNYAIAFGMGITAEKVAQQWNISRADQDAFAVSSHQKALAATAAGKFRPEISPYAVRDHLPDPATGTAAGTNRVPFENNQIPSSRFAPFSNMFIADGFISTPVPTGRESAGLNYTGIAPTVQNDDKWVWRGDLRDGGR